MKALLVAVALLATSLQAQALSSYNPTKMTCSSVKSVIDREGAVMLRWTSPTVGVPRYGRYVRSSISCDFGEVGYGTLVPSKDKKSCGVTTCRPGFPTGNLFD